MGLLPQLGFLFSLSELLTKPPRTLIKNRYELSLGYDGWLQELVFVMVVQRAGMVVPGADQTTGPKVL